MNTILVAVIALGVTALVLAGVLFVVSKKFAVEEDPRVGQVAEVLPQANCGGCGFPGCAGFADACVKAGSLDNLMCPVGGQAVMTKVADILGLSAGAAEPKVAVVRCNGTCEHRPRTVIYDGAVSCKIAHATGTGETGCAFGCLGCGDCVAACKFDAIHMNPETGLPEVDAEKCTACGACVKACPRMIIELRNKGKNGRRMVVLCVNKDKGALTRKACDVGCIGCGKCQKVCPFDAITITNNLAYIDYEKCKLCRKCEDECPQHSIVAVNFPARKPKPAATEAPKVVAPKAETAPKAAAPKKEEAPKAEAPKAEAPKAEAPKAEAPKAEAPKAEAPKAEAPKAEAPKAEAPKAEAPKAEAPKAATPKAEEAAPVKDTQKS